VSGSYEDERPTGYHGRLSIIEGLQFAMAITLTPADSCMECTCIVALTKSDVRTVMILHSAFLVYPTINVLHRVSGVYVVSVGDH
jgi:hypothetical protein